MAFPASILSAAVLLVLNFSVFPAGAFLVKHRGDVSLEGTSLEIHPHSLVHHGKEHHEKKHHHDHPHHHGKKHHGKKHHGDVSLEDDDVSMEDGNLLSEENDVSLEDGNVTREAPSQSRSSAIKPHIVFVLADDLGWNGVGYTSWGNNRSMSKVKTPFIDYLAEDGVRLDAYYAAAYCAPSRFAFLTGRAPWKSEAGYDNFRADTPIGTNPAYEMLPAALKKVGYITHLVGKWHQGFHMDAYLPTNRGFDTSFGIMDSCSYHFTQELFHTDYFHCDTNGHTVIDLMENGAPASWYSPGKLSDDMYRERALRIIWSHNQTSSDQPRQPMFLFLSLQLAHAPYEITEEYSSKYSLSDDENVYWGMHSHVDGTVKAVVKALEDAQMYKNTLLVFTSDNGGPADKFGEPFFANFPFRGHKGKLFEGGIHVPCVVHGGFLPNSARGRQLTGLMSVSDWYATFARISGATLLQEGPSPPDSKDQWEYITGKKVESNRSKLENHYMLKDGIRQSIIRWGKYKMINFHLACEWDSPFPCPEGHRPCTPTEPCVYDLEADPAETIDIAASLPASVLQTMIGRIDATWDAVFAQPFFGYARPSHFEPNMQKACEHFQKQGGFLTPWATLEDEEKFKNRELTLKLAPPGEVLFEQKLSSDQFLYPH